MKLSLDTLRAHLAAEPARAYLVSGDEVLLVGEAADAIRARAKRAGFDEREVHFIERVADWDAVRGASNNLSLFGSRKLIEIRLPSGKPGVGGANAIVELLANVSPDNIYLMITGKLDRDQNNSAWVKAFENHGAWLADLARGSVPAAAVVRARAATHELELDDDAVRFIVERTEGNLLAAEQELIKLRLIAPEKGKGKRVDLAAVQASIGDSARFDVFQLGEAALGGDVPRALRILAGLRSEGVEAPLALWSISREIRNVWGTTAAGPRARLAEAFGRARERQAPRGQTSLRAAGGAISRADRMIKGQHPGDAWDEMALMIVEFAGRRSLPLIGTRVA